MVSGPTMFGGGGNRPWSDAHGRIIVGVKYCFRYNARSRQLRLADEGDPINMENMPRPHRRRREKKLMTMDEVNEKFPMLKYKNWVATRVKEGLPARGGVSAPPSRANSVRSVEGIVPETPTKETVVADAPPATPKEKTEPTVLPKEDSSSTPDATRVHDGQASPSVPTVTTPSAATPTTTIPARASDEHTDDDEDDEHINAAIPPECMGTTGDTCAICIDTIEDDDDVRGLTCGHAFHAVCLDPWLTSRRACCPLCKADYYTPKPRPAAAPEGGDASGTAYVTVAVPPAGPIRLRMPYRPVSEWLTNTRDSTVLQPLWNVFRSNDPVRVQQRNVARAARDHERALVQQERVDLARSEMYRWAPPHARNALGWGADGIDHTQPRVQEAPEGALFVPAVQPPQGSAQARGNWLNDMRGRLPTLRNPLRRQNDQTQVPSVQPVVSGADPANPANPAASSVSPSQLEAGVRAEVRS